jgi:signal transduction histidine kinase
MRGRRGNILIVDDSNVSSIEMARVLGELGHRVDAAKNGRQALERLESETFDLMLLDMVMPEMDGFQVLEHMKREGMLPRMPVIVISALDEMDSVIRCIEAGAEDYLSKPFDHVLLKARIGACLEKKQLRDQEQAYLKQLQAERERLHEFTLELQERNEELDAFAHTVAHDLKGPLGVIVGSAELLNTKHAQLDAGQMSSCLRSIAQYGRKMNNITDELLLLASVRKMTEIELAPLDMAMVVSDAQIRLADVAESERAEIKLPTVWPVPYSYGPWVEEVWVNLLSNAIKYGGHPPVVEVGARQPTNGMVRYWVRDNGEGLDQEEQARIFMPFTRLSQVRSKGHGLGLSIAKRIVERLGGRVDVDSQRGSGSTFSFTLPSAEAMHVSQGA